MNTLPNRYKLFHFSLTMSPLYLVKLQITQKQPAAYCSAFCELIVPDFRSESRSMFVSSPISFNSLLSENLSHSLGFIKKLS